MLPGNVALTDFVLSLNPGETPRTEKKVINVIDLVCM